MDYTTNEAINGELILADNDKRLSAGALDELYIECYLDKPSSKVGALRRAAELLGEPCNISRSRAGQIHARLSYKIEQGLDKRIMEGATLGYMVLYKMAENDDTNEAVRAKCAALLIEYAGKNKVDTSNKKDRSRNDIMKDIKLTQERIALITGADVK